MSDVIRIDKGLSALIKEYRNVNIDELQSKFEDPFYNNSLWDKVDQEMILSKYEHGSDLDIIKDCFGKYLLYRHHLKRGDD